MADMEQYIKNMYGNKTASQKEQLTRDYRKADSDLTAEQQKGQKATAANLNRTAVESKTAAMNDNEYYAAAGLSSGAMMQARLSRDNQTAANMTALRVQQQEADADIERRRSILAEDYASAIRQSQADNDWQAAQALYDNATREDDQLHDERMLEKQQTFQSGEAEKDRAFQSSENQTQRDWESREATKAWGREAQDHYRGPSDWEVAKFIAEESGDFTYVGNYLGLSDEETNNLSGVHPQAAGQNQYVQGMYSEIESTNTKPVYSERAMQVIRTMPNEQASDWKNKGYTDYSGYLKATIDAKRREEKLSNEEALWLLQYYHLY